MTDPVGPTIPDMVSDGSPLPPPISSTFWPIPIRASSTRPAVNGANICAMSTRYLSQYRAEACQASSDFLLCSSVFISFIRSSLPASGRPRKLSGFFRIHSGSTKADLVLLPFRAFPSPKSQIKPNGIDTPYSRPQHNDCVQKYAPRYRNKLRTDNYASAYMPSVPVGVAET